MSRNGHPFLLFAALLAALAVASCSSSFRYPGKKFFESDTKSRAPAAASPAAKAPAAGAPATATESGEGDPSAVAEAEGWQKTGVSEEEGLADSDACYRYANAQVANDVRIDRDIDAARGVQNSLFEQNGNLDRRVDAYYYNNERVARFESCMRSRGYTPN